MMLLLSLVLVGCGKQENGNTINDEEGNGIQQEDAVKTESDFSMSDCMKWCELVRNKETSKQQMLQDCESLCRAGEAIETNDASGCEKAEGVMKDSCYASVAYEKSKSELCDKINDTLMKYGCLMGIAEKTKESDICKRIPDSIRKESCEEAVKNE